MGTFKIELVGVGGHGVDRAKEDGETVNFHAEGDTTPDSIAKTIITHLIELLKRNGHSVVSASLVHWPGEPGEVTDDLITGIRKGSFNAPIVPKLPVELVISIPEISEQSEPPLTEEHLQGLLNEGILP